MRIVPTLIASALPVLVATQALAQTPAGVPPERGRFIVSINGGFQASKQDINRPFTFTLYDEESRIDSIQPDIEGGGLLDIGVSGRVTGRIGAGLAYTFLRSSSGGSVSGAFPHPLFFDQPREFSSSLESLEHTEHGVHLFATWHVPFTEQVDFTLSAGPSIFRVKNEFGAMGDLIDRVVAAEAPPFTSVNVSPISVISQHKTAVGFNVGADATYTITPLIGAGVMIRYSRAEADMDVEQIGVTVKAGGFQIGGGLRLRF